MSIPTKPLSRYRRANRCQFSLRQVLLLFVLVALLFSYVGSYYRLSRRGMREAAEFQIKGFLYAPANDVFASHDLSTHHRLAVFFAPANSIDRGLFGADGPTKGIMFELR